MTTHELARKLLEMPNLPVGLLTPAGEIMQGDLSHIRVTNEKFWLHTENGCETTTASHVVMHRP